MTQDVRLWIEGFYRENYPKLYAYAYSILRHQMDAEAAVQEAFAVACEAPAALLHSENPIGWMKKTVRHRALRIIDERRRTDALLVALKALAPKAEDTGQERDGVELLLLSRSVVSKEEFDFFLRIANGATTVLEESQRLGIKPPACYKRFGRIRDRLQQAIGEYYKY